MTVGFIYVNTDKTRSCYHYTVIGYPVKSVSKNQVVPDISKPIGMAKLVGTNGFMSSFEEMVMQFRMRHPDGFLFMSGREILSARLDPELFDAKFTIGIMTSEILYHVV